MNILSGFLFSVLGADSEVFFSRPCFRFLYVLSKLDAFDRR